MSLERKRCGKISALGSRLLREAEGVSEARAKKGSVGERLYERTPEFRASEAARETINGVFPKGLYPPLQRSALMPPRKVAEPGQLRAEAPRAALDLPGRCPDNSNCIPRNW